MPLPPLQLTPLSVAEQTALAIIKYFPSDQWGNAFNVARIESAGFQVHAWNQNGEDSRGVFQINIVPAANPQFADVDLWDIDNNVRCAAYIYHQWGNWGAWYNSAVALGLPH